MLMQRRPEDNPIPRLFQQRALNGELERALDMVRNSSIVRDCFAIIGNYCDEATRALEILPASECRDSLESMAAYIRERRR